jgi:hypothetical protein
MAEEEPVPKTFLVFSKNRKIWAVSELHSVQLKSTQTHVKNKF